MTMTFHISQPFCLRCGPGHCGCGGTRRPRNLRETEDDIREQIAAAAPKSTFRPNARIGNGGFASGAIAGRYQPAPASAPRVNVQRVSAEELAAMAPPSSFRSHARVTGQKKGRQLREGQALRRDNTDELELAEELRANGPPSSFTRNPNIRKGAR